MTAIIVTRAPEELAQTIPQAPTRFEENMAWREKIADRGGNDERWARAIKLRGQDDPVWWINTWSWTQNPKDFSGSGIIRPLILFEKQGRYVRKLHESVEVGKELLLEKSREQGATVVSANYCGYRLMNSVNANMKVGSRVRELVDGPSFSDQIMPKVDFTLDRMPAWALPEGFTTKKPSHTRKNLLMLNPETGMTWKGEATNKHFSVSGRYAMVWLDEVAKIETLSTIHKSVANTTNCYLYTTTPEGYEMFARMVNSGNHPVFRLHWTDNPLWAPKGYEEGLDWENGLWPEKWICKKGCRVHPEGGMPHSERYDRECEKLSFDPKQISQELDIDYQKSGGAVFQVDIVRKVITVLDNIQPKFKHVALDWELPPGEELPGMSFNRDSWYHATQTWRVVPREVEYSNLRVWKEPVPDHVYAIGGDTSKGLPHGDADCLPILDCTEGEVVAEWHGRTEPEELGVEAAKICKYYGTSSGCEENAYAAVEWNGDGAIVNRVMSKMGITCHRSRSSDKSKAKRIYTGVLIAKNKKRQLIKEHMLPMLRPGDDGMPLLLDPFVEFWRECETFVEATPEQGKLNAEEASVGGMRGCHDDRVMARLSLCVGVREYYGAMKGILPRRFLEELETKGISLHRYLELRFGDGINAYQYNPKASNMDKNDEEGAA